MGFNLADLCRGDVIRPIGESHQNDRLATRLVQPRSGGEDLGRLLAGEGAQSTRLSSDSPQGCALAHNVQQATAVGE